jgi:hypothetical protein
MKPEFALHVEGAATIKSSGRWAAMNAKIKGMAANPGADNGWYVQMFAGLCFQVCSEYSALESAYTENRKWDVSLIAWRARNLLELSIWATYFAKDRKNARRLYEDAGRDTFEIFGKFEKWGKTTAQVVDWLDPITRGKRELSDRAAKEGIDTLEGGHFPVHLAAAECGMDDHYAVANKMFSKFAHPTAMQMLGNSDDVQRALQRDCFFSQGCLYFIGAFIALESVHS